MQFQICQRVQILPLTFPQCTPVEGTVIKYCETKCCDDSVAPPPPAIPPFTIDVKYTVEWFTNCNCCPERHVEEFCAQQLMACV